MGREGRECCGSAASHPPLDRLVTSVMPSNATGAQHATRPSLERGITSRWYSGGLDPCDASFERLTATHCAAATPVASHIERALSGSHRISCGLISLDFFPGITRNCLNRFAGRFTVNSCGGWGYQIPRYVYLVDGIRIYGVYTLYTQEVYIHRAKYT